MIDFEAMALNDFSGRLDVAFRDDDQNLSGSIVEGRAGDPNRLIRLTTSSEIWSRCCT